MEFTIFIILVYVIGIVIYYLYDSRIRIQNLEEKIVEQEQKIDNLKSRLRVYLQKPF